VPAVTKAWKVVLLPCRFAGKQPKNINSISIDALYTLKAPFAVVLKIFSVPIVPPVLSI
jgi:hypothetical protein